MNDKEPEKHASASISGVSISGMHLGHVPRKQKAIIAASVDHNDAEPTQSTISGNSHGDPLIPRKVDGPVPRKKRNIEEIASNVYSNQNVSEGMQASGLARLKNVATAESQLSNNPVNANIRIISEIPFVVGIKTRYVRTGAANLRRQTQPRSSDKRSRSSTNNVSTYTELEDSDSDDYKMTEDEEQKLFIKRMKKKRSKSISKSDTLASSINSKCDDTTRSTNNIGPSLSLTVPIGDDFSSNVFSVATAPATAGVMIDAIESPPPGKLTTLWYSRECFSHVWVMEKICGWKTRPILRTAQTMPLQAAKHSVKILENSNTTANESFETTSHVPQREPQPLLTLDLNTAFKIQQAVLQSHEFRTDTSRRTEVSRINPTNCPVIHSVANEAEKLHQTGRAFSHASVVDDGTQQRELEEVLLVKWRGRSYYHCSWERATDIETFDPSTNNTSRNKIRRFYQQQENLLGAQWKQVLEEERKNAASIHDYGASKVTANEEAVNSSHGDVDQVEEFFSPQCVMVERILACDESEMDLQVLAKQRGLNVRDEQMDMGRKAEREQQRRRLNLNEMESVIGKIAPFVTEDWELPYDPEDNVRYVVKWKGLPYADITWEYWRDIKHDAVEEVEDFWYRQVAPDLEYAKECYARPHPHMREFQKLKESPVFGVSKKPRPVFKMEVDDGEGEGGNDATTTVSEVETGFRLRSYQLEGLNWLLFNWWNHRSCILADEMGLG
jgi:Chromo (CHRromatin Organisation MOdifier) domain